MCGVVQNFVLLLFTFGCCLQVYHHTNATIHNDSTVTRTTSADSSEG